MGGLEPFAARELAGLGGALPLGEGWGEGFAGAGAWNRRGAPHEDAPGRQPGSSLRFRFTGPWPELLRARTVVAIHAVVAAELRRPSALLDDGVFKRLLGAIGHVRAMHPAGSFATFRLSAAGADSPTFGRLRDRLVRETGLRDVAEGGDLLLRFKRAPNGGDFELTVRLSPRSLSARSWRVCNLPGALNATVASVMAGLTVPGPDDIYLNLACGSGTLLIERAALGPAGRLVGCDVDAGALACAAENVAAAGRLLDGRDVELQAWDACAIPLADGSVSALAANLPFGQLVGSHRTNEHLYPEILAEAARLAPPRGRFVAITQQVNLFERCLRDVGAWDVEHVVRLHLPANAGVLKPRVYALRRRGAHSSG